MALEIKDVNEWLKPPEGGILIDVEVAGAFLVVKYQVGDNYVWVYLNNGGREVARVTIPPLPEPEPVSNPPQPKWWERFMDWFARGADIR